jgi:hypothetical protein
MVIENWDALACFALLLALGRTARPRRQFGTRKCPATFVGEDGPAGGKHCHLYPFDRVDIKGH